MTHTKTGGLKVTLILLLTLLFTSCTNDKQGLLTGKWQSLNDRHVSFEFNDLNEKKLIRLNIQGEPGFQDTLLVLESKFRVLSSNRNRLKIIENFGGSNKESLISEIEFISDDRIIMYMYKHHGILDLADEYARTSSPHKFDSIMDAILLTPNEIIH